MTVSRILFSFEGRLTRAPFITVYILVLIAATFLRISVDVLIELSVRHARVSLFWGLALTVAALLVAWIHFAIIIKRCHDRDKSGSWVLLSFIPLIGFLWAIIELGCFPGTRGPNRFGLGSERCVASSTRAGITILLIAPSTIAPDPQGGASTSTAGT